MKKQLTIFVCCLALVLSALSHTKQVPFPKQNVHPKGMDGWEPDTIYSYSIDAPKERYIFSYENGKCTVTLRQEWKNNQWINFSQGIYTYNTQNNRTEELYQDWEST